MNLTDQSKENIYSRNKQEKPIVHRLALQSLTSEGRPSLASPSTSKESAFEYYSEILAQLLKEEQIYQVPTKYLVCQADLDSKMRSILVDWLVSVHRRFKLLPETLFLSIKITDRFLLLQETQRKELQLVGITALFLAAKYEEIYPPQLRDLVLLTDKAYSKEQALAMERYILKTLDFQITMPSSWRFFEKFSEGLSDEGRSMGQYLLELCLIDEGMLRFSESLVAISAVFLSYKFFRKDYVYSLEIYTEQEVKACAAEILVLFQIAQQYPLTAIRDKFANAQYHQVSTICLD